MKNRKEEINSVLADLKEQIFEWFEEYMDEREKLENQCFTVKAVDRKNEMKLFGILLHSKYTFRGFREKKYSINGLQKKALDKVGVKYEVVK